jgi:hypothetical protein
MASLIEELYAELDRRDVALSELAALALRWAPSDEDARLVHALLELPKLTQVMTGPVLTFRDIGGERVRFSLVIDETGRTRVETGDE